MLADTLDEAISRFLEENKSPSRKVNEIDNRGSHFYLALYWAEALAAQDEDCELKNRFSALAEKLRADESHITEELIGVQGKPMDIGGYYFPDEKRANQAMRPSETFNADLATL